MEKGARGKGKREWRREKRRREKGKKGVGEGRKTSPIPPPTCRSTWKND